MIKATRLAVIVALAATALAAQDWEPVHIEALTDYPRLDWISGRTGDVVIRCTLDRDGSVVKAEVKSGPGGLITGAAVKNVALWKFRRVNPKGRNRGGTATIIYQFRLEGGPGDSSHSTFVVDLPNVVHVVPPLPVPMID
jgi:outer membrane biosynthesis protein TonB